MAEFIQNPGYLNLGSDGTATNALSGGPYPGASWGDILTAAALWVGAPYLAGSGALAGLGAGGGAGAGAAGSGAAAAGAGTAGAAGAAGAGAAGAAGAGSAGAGAAGAAGAGAAAAGGATASGLLSNPWVWGGINALAGAYTADQQADVYEEMAKGKLYDPQTAQYLAALQSDAMDAWNTGQFQFGPSPELYNQYLDWGGSALGLDVSGIPRIDPAAAGYGPEAYGWMSQFLRGGATAQPNPAALANVQNPWVAGLMGGLGGYASAGGFGGGSAAPPPAAPSPQMQAATGPSVMDAYQSVVDPYFYYGGY